MAEWKQSVSRGMSLLQDDESDEGVRTRNLLAHVLNESNRDDYVSRDFFNVQQTAGGLPRDVSFDQFLNAIQGHVRDDLSKSNFDPELSDDDFRAALMSLDDNIRRHIRFLNGVVHQAAAGEVHRRLWKLILDARADDGSIYSCYRDFLVDA